MPLLCKPGRAKTYADDARRLLIELAHTFEVRVAAVRKTAFLSGEDLVVYSRTPFFDALECLIHDKSNKCISTGPAFHTENDTDHTITITLGREKIIITSFRGEGRF